MHWTKIQFFSLSGDASPLFTVQCTVSVIRESFTRTHNEYIRIEEISGKRMNKRKMLWILIEKYGKYDLMEIQKKSSTRKEKNTSKNRRRQEQRITIYVPKMSAWMRVNTWILGDFRYICFTVTRIHIENSLYVLVVAVAVAVVAHSEVMIESVSSSTISEMKIKMLRAMCVHSRNLYDPFLCHRLTSFVCRLGA